MRYAQRYCKFEVIANNEVRISGPYFDKPNQQHSVTVTLKELEKYNSGQKIQDCFPNLSAEDREFLISGFSPEGWENL